MTLKITEWKLKWILGSALPIALLPVLVIACNGAGKLKPEGLKAPSTGATALKCKNAMPARDSETPLFLEDIVDGKDGTYRLTLMEGYTESTLKDAAANLLGRASLSEKTDMNEPTAYQELVCQDLTQVPDGTLTFDGTVPIAIQRKDGEIGKDLKMSIALYGQDTKLQNELKYYSVLPSFSSVRKMKTNAEQSGIDLKFYKVAENSFEIRLKTTQAIEDGQISLTVRAVYVYVP